MTLKQRHILLWIYCFSIAPGLCWGVIGCETTVTDASLPYSEKLVISGIITAGDSIKNIQISHTVAPLDTYSLEKVFIKDAVGSVMVDGKSYPIQFQGLEDVDTLYIQNGLVRSLYRVPNLVAEAGKRYALRVEWRGKIATAETFVPEALSIVSSRIVPREVAEVIIGSGGLYQTRTTYASVEVTVHARANETFGIATADYFQYLALPDVLRYRFGSSIPDAAVLGASSSNGTVVLQYPLSLGYPVFQGYVIYAGCSSFDAAVHSYFLYRNSYSPFGSGTLTGILNGEPSRNPTWNIRGDGIGMFIGRSEMAIVRAQ